jgi:hypothetical protein
MPEVLVESNRRSVLRCFSFRGCCWRHEPARHPVDRHRRGVLMAAIRQRGGEQMGCRLGRGL